MAKPLDPRISDILKQYHPNPSAAVWDCHGTMVIYHKDVEIVAAAAGIVFDKPTVLEANGKDRCVALCVTAHHGDRSDWSVGEASPGNNKNAYPYAMAEKRARDRVVLKLLGLAGFVYSEDEADDFKQPHHQIPIEQGEIKQQPETTTVKAARMALEITKSEDALSAWYEKNKKGIEKLPENEKDAIRAAYKTHLANLRQKEAA